MDEIIISIIIPIYNAEEYIDRCMESILNQTFTRYEVILVDDGSEDSSGKICDGYALNDSRVRVIHKENGGVSSARNMGLEKSVGEYVAFIDADDVLDTKYLEVLYTNAVENAADISCCGYIEIDGGYDGRVISSYGTGNGKRIIDNGNQVLREYFGCRGFYGCIVWAKIIKKSLAVSEKFEALKYGEDAQYMLKLFQRGPKTYLDTYKGYFYIRWDKSATKRVDTLSVQRIKDEFALNSFILESCLKSGDEALIKTAEKNYADFVYSKLSRIIKRKDRSRYDEVKNILLDGVNTALKSKNIGTKHNAMLSLYKLNPDLYWSLISGTLKVKGGKKAAIITIYDPMPNYGNRLQNYAVQTVLESLGMKTETIACARMDITLSKIIKYCIHRLFGYKLPGDKRYWKAGFPRLLVFNGFNKKYINTKYISEIGQAGTADYYVLGSDQVWNTAWYQEGDMKKELFLLNFAPPEKRVCFSPSFGTEDLDPEWEPWFRENLKSFPRFSVREEVGARLIKNLTGKDAAVLIDPTMMLSRAEWMKIANKPKKIDLSKPYILTYFLGGRSERVNNDLQKFAEENRLQVYNLLDISQPELYASGPGEFIYLVSNANLVLTDSFHACVFSFLFGKPFLVYAREGKENNMMSRMDTLLKKFRLERKYADSGLSNELFEADYAEGYKQLEEERAKALNFLKKSMNME